MVIMDDICPSGVLDTDEKLRAPKVKNISQFLTNHMVDIFVGTERKKFHLHRDLLCERSDFFQASFGGIFKEAETQELALPEDSVESFELMVGWLYSASLMSVAADDELLAYLELFVLAQKLCLEHLQNETMDHILRFYRTSSPKVDGHRVRFVYENVTADDRVRRFFIEYAAWKVVWDRTSVFDLGNRDLLEGGGEIALDFASKLAEYCFCSHGSLYDLQKLDPRRRSNCCYHKHDSTPVCGEASNETTPPRTTAG